ncbi:MAG: glycosyltransferase [Candidatus Aenigmatarchaeota archaeon]
MITIIVPVFNEAEIIKKNLLKIIHELKKLKKRYEIIVAEDGSTDKSYEIVKKIEEENKKIKVLHHKKRLGRGLALKRCSSVAKGKFIIYMDADLSTKLDALKIVLKELNKYDIVVGSRYIKGAKYKRTLKRLFLSKIYNLIRLILFPDVKIKDTQCGFKGFKRNVFIEINKEVKSNDWFWDTEFLIKAKRKGFKIKEIPVVWVENKKSSIKILRDGLKMVAQLIKLRFFP